MRNFNTLDPSALKAFYFAALELNFTKAAQQAGLTQSGISQHIQKLESELNTELFIRHNRQMHLSDSGKELLLFIENYLDSIDQFNDRIQKQNSKLSGQVRYAMPDSCLFSPHFSMLLNRRQTEFSDVTLSVEICDSDIVIDLLLNNAIDFGFTTKAINHKHIELSKFVTEEYILVTSNKQDLQIKTVADLKKLNFITYPGAEDLFNHWIESEFSHQKNLDFNQMNISGKINSISGAIKMVEGGLGVSVFQRHCIEDSIENKRCFAYKSKNLKSENNIYIATLKNKKNTLRVEKVIATFLEMKQKKD